VFVSKGAGWSETDECLGGTNGLVSEGQMGGLRASVRIMSRWTAGFCR